MFQMWDKLINIRFLIVIRFHRILTMRLPNPGHLLLDASLTSILFEDIGTIEVCYYYKYVIDFVCYQFRKVTDIYKSNILVYGIS